MIYIILGALCAACGVLLAALWLTNRAYDEVCGEFDRLLELYERYAGDDERAIRALDRANIV